MKAKTVWVCNMTLAPVLLLICFFPTGTVARQPFDFRAYLLRHNHLGDALKRECGAGDLITGLQIQYADLIGEGDKQAVVEATTCMMGNGGADIVEVFRMRGGRDPLPLSIDDSSYPAGIQELYAGEIRTPRLTVQKGKLIRWFVRYRQGPTHEAPKPEETRTITYCWRKVRFIICGVNDQLKEILHTEPVIVNKYP